MSSDDVFYSDGEKARGSNNSGCNCQVIVNKYWMCSGVRKGKEIENINLQEQFNIILSLVFLDIPFSVQCCMSNTTPCNHAV